MHACIYTTWAKIFSKLVHCDSSFLSLLFRYIFVASTIGGEVVIFERSSENDLIKRQVRISD